MFLSVLYKVHKQYYKVTRGTQITITCVWVEISYIVPGACKIETSHASKKNYLLYLRLNTIVNLSLVNIVLIFEFTYIVNRIFNLRNQMKTETHAVM